MIMVNGKVSSILSIDLIDFNSQYRENTKLIRGFKMATSQRGHLHWSRMEKRCPDASIMALQKQYLQSRFSCLTLKEVLYCSFYIFNFLYSVYVAALAMKMSVKLQSLYQCTLFLYSLKRLHCSLEFSSRNEYVTLFLIWIIAVQGSYAKKRQGLVELVRSVLKLAVMVRGVIFPKRTKRFTNHNKLVQPTNQSKLSFSKEGAS